MRTVFLLLVITVTASFAQLRIDAGSATDQFFQGGTAYTYPSSPATFPTMRFGGNFTYSIPLAPGDYIVTLSFIERIVSAPGAHVFNVSINGSVVLPNLDIFAVAGQAPLVRAFPVTVAASPLTVQFASVVRNAIVNRIDVAPVARPLSPVYLAGLDADRPATCPPTGLTFYVAKDVQELWWCMAPGAWVKATSRGVILGKIIRQGEMVNGACVQARLHSVFTARPRQESWGFVAGDWTDYVRLNCEY